MTPPQRESRGHEPSQRGVKNSPALIDPMTSAADDRILDFGASGMWWEITRSTADTSGEYFEAINVINANFDGPPLHIHPTAHESYAVVEGTLDVCINGTWRTLSRGESSTVPPGTSHTLRNT